jgi:hypothetical protein
MTRHDRRTHLRTLRRQEAIQCKNTLRLTLPHTDVSDELSKPRYTKGLSTRIIHENLMIDPTIPLDEKRLGACAILSSATCGQPWMVGDIAREKLEAG